jgi:LysM repeat protein
MHSKPIIAIALAAILITPAVASADAVHTVAPGESLSSIAAADGLSVAELAAANGLSAEAQLESGTTLAIPAESASSTPPESPASIALDEATPQSASYVVEPGDTLSAIAADDDVSVQTLAAANGIDPQALLLAGTALQLPQYGTTSSTASGDDQDSADIEDPVEATAPARPVTAEAVSPAEVGEIATENGVPAALAEAIADQESGFNNDEVSSVGARGVMQILPGTWDWIEGSLAGSSLAGESAAENVRAGSLMLHALLAEAGGDPELAIADYYQGPASVREHGEYPETERYVEDVLALEQQFSG